MDGESIITGKKKSLIPRIKDTPNKKGGFAKNPFVRKNKIADELNDQVLKQLSDYDPLPVNSNVELGFGDVDANFRLDELKALSDKRLLKQEEIDEAKELLKKVKAID